MQPYSIYRENVRRITPTEMSLNRDGQFYYFDTDVVSLSPHSIANINRNSYLVADKDTYKSQGYRHQVADPAYTYSTKEEGKLEMSLEILPLGLPDSLENYVSVLHSSIEISYERAQLVESVQEIINSVQDRVTSANLLARHFLPAYVSYEVEYKGGSRPEIIAKDIINYIENIPVGVPVDVSEIENKIYRRGGNPETPTKVSVLVHDWNREMWAEFSENEVGGSKTNLRYHGSPRVSYFVAGPDASNREDEVIGERIIPRRV
jgi:hypothetical protein